MRHKILRELFSKLTKTTSNYNKLSYNTHNFRSTSSRWTMSWAGGGVASVDGGEELFAGVVLAKTRPKRAENIFAAKFARANSAGRIIRCSPLPQGDETVKYSINLKGNGRVSERVKGRQFCGTTSAVCNLRCLICTEKCLEGCEASFSFPSFALVRKTE